MTKNRLASRTASFAVLAALSAVSLVACGSDPSGSAEPGSNAGSTASEGASASGLACPEGKLAAEGSTAQGNAITEVIAIYKAEERCQGNAAWNLPMVTGPIAFAYNIDGVDKLVLNAEVLAGIFNGSIKTWDDEKIAKLNSDVELPGEKITVFFRSDESGTTENTTKFLSKAGNGAWKEEPSKTWTGTGEGKNKSSGVAEGVTNTKNSISYMEWSYAKDNNLKMAQ